MRGGFGLVGAVLLLAAAPALGATRYAEPSGNGPPASCPESDPCEIRAAITDPAVRDGDEVVLMPGAYDVGAPQLQISAAIEVHGQAGQPRPTLSGTPSTILRLSNPDAVLSDVNLTRPSGLFLLGIDAGTAERVAATSGGSYACQITGGTLRDSTCSATGGGVAVFGGSVSSPGSYEIELRNVTARAVGSAGAYAVVASALSGGQTTVSARNVIADGEASDIFATAPADPDTSAAVTMQSSNFQTATTGGVGVATPAGAGTNQTEPPLLADPAAGDFHQLAGSPTIDAGTSDSLLGPLDLDRQARIDGGAPDIGADEVQSPPETTLEKRPKKKVRTRKGKAKARFGFSSSEPGSQFECVLDGKARSGCEDGEFTKKVRKGKHDFEVTAIDAAGNRDPTPVTYRWKVKRKR